MMRAATGLAVLLAACGTGAPDQPRLAAPGAVQELSRMKDMAARGDWAGLAAVDVPACAGANDAVCAERHALRARGCARMAGNSSETARRDDQSLKMLKCAVESGRAALAASAATPAAERTAWREAYASALFERRQARPGSEACEDNAPLLAEADRLRAETPAAPRPRFLAASARLTAVARRCDPGAGTAARCAELAAASALLRDPPPDAAAQWRSLAAGIAATARSLPCPT
jgi:hypothetical protein